MPGLLNSAPDTANHGFRPAVNVKDAAFSGDLQRCLVVSPGNLVGCRPAANYKFCVSSSRTLGQKT
jgi:hypothetical protein